MPLRSFPFIASATAVVIAALVLIGWGFDIETFKRVFPGFVAMNPLTAICFVVAGLALALIVCFAPSAARVYLARAMAFLIIWVGVMKLASLVGGSSSYQLDAWFFPKKLNEIREALPNRMAPNTAVNFILAGLGLVGLDLPRTRLWLCHACAVLLGFGALLPLVGYAYGVESFTGFASFIPMALHTALTFLFLAIGIFFAAPEAPLPQIFAARDPRGIIARRLLPLAIGLTLLLGWVRIWGERQGYYESAFGTVLFVFLTSLMFVLLVRWTVSAISRVEQERAEKERRLTEATRRKDEMVAVISHDLCSPLSGLQLVVDMLRSNEGKPDDHLLDLLDHSARRMISMVRTLLDSAGAETAELRLESTELRVSGLVEKSLEPLLISAEARRLDIQLDLAPEEPAIHGDRLRVAEIFNHLLANAVKFTPDGGTIRIEIERAFAGVRVRVCDSGPGILESDLPFIFDKYYQGSSAVLSGEPGAGLGLAVAREMALLHNGYISVETEAGRGSTFIVYLPVGLAPLNA